jgi:hypothetical protein
MECEYNIPFTLPAKPEEKEGRVIFGWEKGFMKDISNYYLTPNSNTTIINGTITANLSFGGNCSSTLTQKDQEILDYSSYYIPKGYTVNYQWLDTWSPNSEEYVLPAAAVRIYGRDEMPVPAIPNYEDYIIDNADTVKWYLDTEKTLTNEWDIIPSTYLENIVFYALKSPKERYINFNTNNENLGYVHIINPSETGTYSEGSTIDVYVVPINNGAFLHWDNDSINPKRTVEVGSKNANYLATFRDDSIEKGVLALYAGTNLIKYGYLGISGWYKEKPHTTPYLISIEKPSEATNAYDFTYNSSTGYYVSQNKGKHSSYALCQLNIMAPTGGKLYVDCINYAESTFDYGVLS